MRPTFSRAEYINACFCFEIRAGVYTRKIRDQSLIGREDDAGGTTRCQRTAPFLPVSLHDADFILYRKLFEFFISDDSATSYDGHRKTL